MTRRNRTTAPPRGPPLVTRASTRAASVAAAPTAAPTEDASLSTCAGHNTEVGTAILEPMGHIRTAAPAAFSPRQERPTMIPSVIARRNPMPSDTPALLDPLPPLSKMLHQTRLFADGAAGGLGQWEVAAVPATSHRARCILEPFNKLSEKDWDQLLGTTAPAGDYVSPDILPYINGDDAIQGSTELEMSGHEFISSPPIPVTGPVPRVFGEMLLPTRPLDSNPFRRGSDTVFSMRHALHENTGAPPTLPSFESIRELIAPSITHRQLKTRPNPPEKSARARLFGSPTDHDKENQPANAAPREPSPSHTRQADAAPVKLAGHAAKKPLGTSRRSLDSAMTPPPTSQLLQRTSNTFRRSKDCSVRGCGKGARSKGLCKRHGGGKRCSYDQCTRSDQGGGLCIAHGGGKRCTIMACGNAAQSGGLCKSHGGGKRCTVSGCFRSSQGRGLCRTHGGGQLCKVSGCSNRRHTGDFCHTHNVARKNAK